MSDKIDNRLLLFWYYLLRGLALILLPFALMMNPLILVIFVFFYGLEWAATVPPTIRLTSNIFGNQGSIIFGWMLVIHQIGAALATYLGGLMHTISGDYTLTFFSGATFCLISAGLVTRIRKKKLPALANR